MKLKFLSTVAAVALLSSMSIASEIDISVQTVNVADVDGLAGTPTSSVTVAQELLVGSTEDADLNTVARSIQYLPSIGIAENTLVTFNLTNGAIKQTATLYLIGSGGAKQATMFSNVTDGNGNFTSVTFSFDNSVVAHDETLLPGNTRNLIMSTTTGTRTSPIVVANEGLVEGDTVSIVAVDGTLNGNPVSGPNAASETLLTIVDGLSAKIVSPDAASIVVTDTAAPANIRKTFLADAQTTPTTSTATGISVLQGAAAEIGVNLTAVDLYELVIERTDCSAVVAGAAGITLGVGPAGTRIGTDCSWKWTGNFGDALGTQLIAAAGNSATITVDGASGTDVLQSGTWTATLIVKSIQTSPQYAPLALLNKEVSHNWSYDGEEFKVPYMHTSASYGTYVIMTNSSNKDAEVYLDVYADKSVLGGQTQTSMACANVSLATLPANSTAAYYPSAILSSIDATAGCANFSTNNGRYMGKFLVAAPIDSIDAAAFQKDGVNGKRSIPVLTPRLRWNAATGEDNGHGWGE